MLLHLWYSLTKFVAFTVCQMTKYKEQDKDWRKVSWLDGANTEDRGLRPTKSGGGFLSYMKDVWNLMYVVVHDHVLSKLCLKL